MFTQVFVEHALLSKLALINYFNLLCLYRSIGVSTNLTVKYDTKSVEIMTIIVLRDETPRNIFVFESNLTNRRWVI
jgi:hypothetical protein